MKNLIFIGLLVLSFSALSGWENPAVQCPEKIFPQGFTCPDLTGVKNIWDDFPDSMTEAEIAEWKLHRAPDLKVCRYREMLRREKVTPGTFTPVQVQIAWMVTNGGKNPEGKLKSVISASEKFGIPPHILIGAITQESLLASLGISPDGGNYSCGIAQLNISEWCQGMKNLTQTERDNLKWPVIDCGSISGQQVEPFYDIAFRRLGDRPDYQITASDFEGITQEETGLGTKSFQAAQSFIKNCQNDELSIRFKAAVLKNLFVNYVPSPLQSRERLTAESSRPLNCKVQNNSPYYPLHTGWLLAVAAYNAGPRVTSIVEHYYQVQRNEFPLMTPKDLVEALHWGGKVKPGTTSVAFTGQNGKPMTQSWYKSCVVQRHVARVVQHVTLPGQTILKSIEQSPCVNGEVPEYRRNSSGIHQL